jgi:hypothetical protein
MLPPDFWNAAKVWLDLLQWVLTGVVGIVVWQVKRDKTQTTLMSDFRQEFTDKVAEHHVRLELVEERLKHTPKDTEVTKLTAQIESLEKSIDKLSLMVDRQQQFLMNNR